MCDEDVMIEAIENFVNDISEFVNKSGSYTIDGRGKKFGDSEEALDHLVNMAFGQAQIDDYDDDDFEFADDYLNCTLEENGLALVEKKKGEYVIQAA